MPVFLVFEFLPLFLIHSKPVARDFQVELAHHVDVFDELRGERREVDLVDVHLLLLDEIKQQVERTFKDLEFDFVFGHRGTGNGSRNARILRAANARWQRDCREADERACQMMKDEESLNASEEGRRAM